MSLILAVLIIKVHVPTIFKMKKKKLSNLNFSSQ